MRWVACILLSLLAVSTAVAEASETTRKITERHVRPGDPSQPTPVLFNAFIIDVQKIDDVAGTITVDYFLALRWKDERLADAAFKNPSVKANLTEDDIWHPHITSVNLQDEGMGSTLLNIDPEGNVILRKRSVASFNSPLKLQHFPFDEQSLKLRFLSSIYTDKDLDLKMDPTRTGTMDDFSISGWAFTGFTAEGYTQSIQPLGGDVQHIAGLQLLLDFKRKPAFYVWKVFFPLGLIAFMAWTVFWIDPANFGGQVAISTSSVITLIAFQLSLSELLPRISYLTNIDVYAIGTSLLVFIALGESILTARLAKIEKHELSLFIDRHMRWVYPLVYALLTLIVVI